MAHDCMYREINRDRVCVGRYKVCVCRVKERWREKEYVCRETER